MKFIKLIVTMTLVLSLIGPSITSANTQASSKQTEELQKTVESYEIEVLSDEMVEVDLGNGITEMQYIVTGYEKVNAITEVKQSKSKITTKTTTLSDFYDTKGNFVNSTFEVAEFNNDFLAVEATQKTSKKTYKTPQLGVSVKKSATKFNSLSLTDNQEENIEDKLTNLAKNVEFDNVETKQEKAISLEDMESLQELSLNIQEYDVISMKNGQPEVNNEALSEMLTKEYPEVSTKEAFAVTAASTPEMAGAFDNYYNHWTDTGKFVAQALSGAGHKYVRITGTTSGNSTNASTMTKFKSAINSYEDYVEARMNYAAWPEVAGWFGVLMGLASIVAGFITGPAGWVEIVLYYGGALSTFGGLTSSAYATASRLSLSKNAAQYCQNARNLLNYKNWSNYSATVVSGF